VNTPKKRKDDEQPVRESHQMMKTTYMQITGGGKKVIMKIDIDQSGQIDIKKP
jgi:hypothetical protein